MALENIPKATYSNCKGCISGHMQTIITNTSFGNQV